MVYKYYVPVLSVFWLWFLKPAELRSGVRNKRILFGISSDDERRDDYPSFRYYMFLAKGFPLDRVSDPDGFTYWLGLSAPSPHHLECGGVLLTPSIVQTACHCISNFFFSGKPGTNVSKAFPLNVWEDHIYSYFGSNIVIDMYDMLRPKHYVVYTKCRKLEGIAQIGMFDYGLIISGDTIGGKNPEAKISYAPVYKAADTLKFYYEAINKEFMCLLIGHGPFQLDDNLLVDPEASNEVRWGWRTVMNYVDCFSLSYSLTQRKMYRFDYRKEATWVCAQAFSTRNFEYYLNMEGDSGGPMTCNNVYFSIFSMTVDIDDEENVVSYSGPIVNTHFENAAEYRDALIRFVNDFDTTRPTEHPEYDDYTATPPPEHALYPELWPQSTGHQNIVQSALLFVCSALLSAL